MAACISLPHLDVAQSQYFLPRAAAELRVLAANASARAEYKAQLQKEYETSRTFQRQVAVFVAQFVHQQQRSLNLFNVPSLDTSSCLLSSTSAFAPPSPVSTYPSYASRTRSSDTLAKIRRRQASLLVPPRPRLSSALSPTPPHTLLPGPLRRPMPIHRARAPPEALRKQAVLNCAHGRSVPHDALSEEQQVDEKLGQSWVIVPGEDWEIVDAGSNL